MINKVAINTYLSTIESKKTKLTSRTEIDSSIQRTFSRLLGKSGVGRMGKKGQGIKKYKLVVTEYSWEYKIQNGKYSQ